MTTNHPAMVAKASAVPRTIAALVSDRLIIPAAASATSGKTKSILGRQKAIEDSRDSSAAASISTVAFLDEAGRGRGVVCIASPRPPLRHFRRPLLGAESFRAPRSKPAARPLLEITPFADLAPAGPTGQAFSGAREQSVNNLLPNTRQQEVLRRAKPTKNHREITPASTC